MFDLTGRAALVTGSTKGIGRAIAISFAEMGADVIVHGRKRTPEAESAMEECRAHGVGVEFIGADLAGPTAATVQQVFDEATSAFPNLDILINNAGGATVAPYEEVTLESFERTQRVHVTVPYFLTQLFARHWVESRIPGRVVIVGSINGRLSEPNLSSYDISRGAVEMMVRALAVALAPKNIRVNGLAPGVVMSEATRWLEGEPAQAEWIKYHTPNGLIPDADVCAGGAVYLVSDEAEHVHGHMLLIDGGLGAWQFPARESWGRTAGSG